MLFIVFLYQYLLCFHYYDKVLLIKLVQCNIKYDIFMILLWEVVVQDHER